MTGYTFFSRSLMMLTVVAIVSVHWPKHAGSMADLFNDYRFEKVERDRFGNDKLVATHHKRS